MGQSYSSGSLKLLIENLKHYVGLTDAVFVRLVVDLEFVFNVCYM